MKSILKITSIFYISILWPAIFLGQDAVKLSCTEVLSDGSVIISWTPPQNSTGFDRHIFYYSTNGTNFTEVGQQTDVTSTSFTHASAQANDGIRYYYIETRYLASQQLSDTLKTIFLQLNNFNFEEARLFWNTIHNPLPEGSSTFTHIYREYPLGNWLLTATVTDTLRYSEPVIVCNDSINYRIEIENSNGCKSVSNIKGARFKNVNEPDKPVIDSISINANENIVIGWEPVGNAQAYIIYRFDAGIWTPIDTVVGVNNTFYEDTLSNPCNQSLTYSVATIDTCGSSGPKDENEDRKSLRISEAEYNACEESVVLKWNAYRGPEASQYNIWFSKDGGTFQYLAQTAANDTVFTHLIPDVGSGYTYYIRAFFTSGTSTSCKKSVQSFGFEKPSFVYLANVDVLPNDDIQLTIHGDTSINNCTWEIYRDNIEPVISTKIASIEKNGQLTYPISFTDENANPNTETYTYSVKVLDSCGNKVLESNSMSTILLSGTSVSINLNELEWSPLKGWDTEVEKYYIYRMFNAAEPGIVLDSVDGNTLTYTDDLSIVSNLSAIPVYWVMAKQKPGNQYGFMEKARSNRITLVKESEMFIANAFKPGGYTPEFKPVFRFYSGQNYLFQIFNRWGALIFESKNPDLGWDGRYDGKYAQSGVYVYKLIYDSRESGTIQKTGSFTVIY